MSAMTAVIQVRWEGPPPRVYTWVPALGSDRVRQAVLAHYRALPTMSAVEYDRAGAYLVSSAAPTDELADFTGEFVEQVTRPFTVRFPFTEDGGTKVASGRLRAEIV